MNTDIIVYVSGGIALVSISVGLAVGLIVQALHRQQHLQK